MEPAPGLYLHVPFCSAICPYCDFAVTKGGADARARFVAALVREIALWGERAALGTAPFDTVYLGGGTPSLLTAAQLGQLLDAVRTHLPLAADAWSSLEANPEDVTPDAAASWRALGVRTVTLGVQSFDDDALRFLGRRHDGDRARQAVAVALAAGFDSVGVDLIYGLPGQTEVALRHDLDAALALRPHHLSCYQLTVHAGTPFGFRAVRGALRELSEPEQATLFRLVHRHLANRAYGAYEVSSFARGPAHRSRHNGKYWRHAPYLGVGPSAHSFDGARRWWNRRKTGPWSEALAAGELPIEASEPVGSRELALEHLMLGLRTRDGVDLGRLRALGVELAAWNAPLLEALQRQGLVELHAGRLVPTLDGWAIADGLAARFTLDPCPAPQGGVEAPCIIGPPARLPAAHP